MSLQLKITAMVVGIVSLSVVATGVTLFYFQRSMAESNFENAGLVLADTLLTSLEEDMLESDHVHIQQAVSRLGASSGTNSLSILNSQGEVTASTLATSIGMTRSDPQILETIATATPSTRRSTAGGGELNVVLPVVNGPECYLCHQASQAVLGVIEVAIDASSLTAQLQRQGGISIALGVLGFILTSGALVVVFRRTITGRLSRLGSMARRIGDGDYTVRSMDNDADEIGQLGRAFDSTAEHLGVHERESQAFHQELEETVERRTQELDDARGYLRSALDSLQDQVMGIDMDYRITLVNHAMLEDMGWPEDGALGRYCYEVSHGKPDSCDNYGEECPIETVRRTGKSHTVVHIHRAHDGREVHLEIVASPVRNSEGEIVEVLESLRDVTERVEAGRALARNAEERAELLKNLISAQEEERKRIARDLHDEIGQALTAVAMSAAIAAEALPAEFKSVKADMERARSQAQQALSDVRRIVSELKTGRPRRPRPAGGDTVSPQVTPYGERHPGRFPVGGVGPAAPPGSRNSPLPRRPGSSHQHPSSRQGDAGHRPTGTGRRSPGVVHGRQRPGL